MSFARPPLPELSCPFAPQPNFLERRRPLRALPEPGKAETLLLSYDCGTLSLNSILKTQYEPAYLEDESSVFKCYICENAWPGKEHNSRVIISLIFPRLCR